MIRRIPEDKLRIILVGAGILGGRVLSALMDAGFRRVVVDDEFTVTQKDVDMRYFFPEDVGIRKRSTAIVDRVDKPSDAHLVAISTPVPSMDSWNYDLYIGCSCINRDRSIMNTHAREYGIPFVDGIVSDGMWRMQIIGRSGPCLDCFLRDSSVHRPVEDPVLADDLSVQLVNQILSLNEGSSMPHGVYFSGQSGYPVCIDVGTSPECRHHTKHGVQS